jgi:hypothetical protein
VPHTFVKPKPECTCAWLFLLWFSGNAEMVQKSINNLVGCYLFWTKLE